MIKVFSGSWRGPGRREKALGLIVGFEFRKFLHLFKGAKLSVFMDIILHCDEEGHCWPSYDLIERETGYTRHSIAYALDALCEIKLEGEPVLIRWRERDEKGQYIGSNHYLIFPTPEEVDAQSAINDTLDAQSAVNPTVGNSNGGETALKVNPDIKEKPIWELTWEAIRAQLYDRSNNYQDYIAPLQAIGLENHCLVLAAPSEERRLWVESRLPTIVTAYLKSMNNWEHASVQFVLQEQQP